MLCGILFVMPDVLRFPRQPDSHKPSGGEQPADSVIAAVRMMLGTLQPDERERVLAELSEMAKPTPTPRAGDVLGAIVKMLPRQRDWTVADIKGSVEEQGVEATSKEIYNALGYLTRKKHVTRVGYGRYIVDGMSFVTSDEFGGGPSITEGDADD